MKSPAHIIRVDRRRSFSSATLDEATCGDLEAAFRGVRWWRDAWRDRKFHQAARSMVREHGGLAIVGPGVSFEMPPPFNERFEPIEIGRGWLGDDRTRLATLSGAAPTRQEWVVRYLLGPIGIIALTGLVIALFHYQFRPPQQIVFVLVAMTVSMAIPFSVIMIVRSLRNRWYLLPGAIAIFRRPPRRGEPARVTVLSRNDSCLVIRYVHRGKTVVLMLELWAHRGRVYRTPVSEREAISALACWQSELAPPPEEQLFDLATA